MRKVDFIVIRFIITHYKLGETTNMLALNNNISLIFRSNIAAQIQQPFCFNYPTDLCYYFFIQALKMTSDTTNQ